MTRECARGGWGKGSASKMQKNVALFETDPFIKNFDHLIVNSCTWHVVVHGLFVQKKTK